MGARFQVCFTPLPGFFSPFPRGTCSLSVTVECLALEGGPPGFGRGFACPALLGMPAGPTGEGATGLSPCAARLSSRFAPPPSVPCPGPATPADRSAGLGSGAFARRYSRRLVLISFPRGTEMFHFPRCRPRGLSLFSRGCRGSRRGGLPHSETRGSMGACPSPRIFAACRVLRRLTVPRHPSCARIRLAGLAPALGFIRCSCMIPRLFDCQRSAPPPAGQKGLQTPLGGRAWNRTRDLVLIRDAL